MTDSLTVFGTDYTGVTGIKAKGTGNGTLTYIRPQGTKSINSNGTGIDVTEYASIDVSVSSSQPNLQAKTGVNPSTSSQTIEADSGYDGLSSVQINAMPNGSVSASASKGSVSNHAISVTPTATVGTAGYLAAGSTNGTAVSVSASELVSGTYSVNSSGTKDVTNYASASVPAGSVSASASKGTVSNHSVSVTPTATVSTAGYIAAGSTNGTAVSVSASELVSGSQTITENDTYDVTNLASVVVNVSGGGSTMQVGTATRTLSSSAGSIQFTNLSGSPTSFIVTSLDNVPVGAASIAASVAFDGSGLFGDIITNTNNAQVSYTTSAFNMQYDSGTLSISSSGADFQAGDYKLVYTYGGTSGDVYTEDVQVGSGATSITFTGLEDEPSYWSCVFKSNFGTSNGYQRVITVVNDGADIYGLEMDSGAHYSGVHWTATYNNGSLTITSNGTNQGGYFHQPGYYQLTYAIAGDGGNYQSKTVTPTTSQQVVQADSGYDALKKVTVNAIPNTYVQPTSTVGSTTYRASTSAQTIQSGTYHSAVATIAAVSQTNLSAENIKSGTTISISNGQSNLWSVTGSYTGGGGGANFGTVTMTNSSNQAQSIGFTLPSGRTPKAFFARLTTQITRSSSSRYYYVENMRWDGSTTGGVAGRCFYMSSGQLTNITSGYSYSQSGTTFTLSSTGTRSASPGSFYNGTYELVYVY